MRGASTVDDKRLRCPRCRARSTIQNAIELRPGVQYMTLRCTSCGLLHDAQTPSSPPTVPSNSFADDLEKPLAVEPSQIVTKSRGPPPMDTQPSAYQQDRQAVPVAQSIAKKGKRKIPSAQPGVPPHKAERARKASLKKQREQLTMQAGARSSDQHLGAVESNRPPRRQ